jgi:hypothetical protein
VDCSARRRRPRNISKVASLSTANSFTVDNWRLTANAAYGMEREKARTGYLKHLALISVALRVFLELCVILWSVSVLVSARVPFLAVRTTNWITSDTGCSFSMCCTYSLMCTLWAHIAAINTLYCTSWMGSHYCLHNVSQFQPRAMDSKNRH